MKIGEFVQRAAFGVLGIASDSTKDMVWEFIFGPEITENIIHLDGGQSM